jgi:hypothetical protein
MDFVVFFNEDDNDDDDDHDNNKNNCASSFLLLYLKPQLSYSGRLVGMKSSLNLVNSSTLTTVILTKFFNMQATNMNFFPHYLTIGRSIL